MKHFLIILFLFFFQLCLDLKDVTDITKQKTARLFSNAIAVSTTDKEVCVPIVLQIFTVIKIMHLTMCFV